MSTPAGTQATADSVVLPSKRSMKRAAARERQRRLYGPRETSKEAAFMAPTYFQKPEAALKRAQELIHVGKEQDALDALHETIKARRHKQWSQTHEEIMMLHVTLCVTLRKPHMAKDALFQYKTLTQQVAVTSLEKVISHLLTQAQQKAEDAQKTSIEKVEEIDDLDQGDAPEHLLLSVVSGAAAQDRMDRTVLAPWLRFLWDSFRNCLELLRNNAQVEHLYHKVTRQSLAFCAKYQRRTEFRKLSDLLRLHLNQIQKQQHLPHGVKLSSPESLVLMQDTRLCQLDTAIQMELWQEAYRSAEDVHGMMQLSKDKDRRMVKVSSYVNYYDKLSLVFWKAGNSLFHAAALLQKFVIYKDMKKTFSDEEAQDQATRVLLATLAIPDGAEQPSDLCKHLDMDDHHMANMRLLSNLLKLPIAPTRSSILREAVRLGIPEMANQPSIQLHKLLESDVSPNKLSSQAEIELSKVASVPEYGQYIEALRSVIATKAIKQIAAIYDTISWARLRRVVPFYDDLTLESFVVDISKHRVVRATVDHREGCVRFGSGLDMPSNLDLEENEGFASDDNHVGIGNIRSHLEKTWQRLREINEWLEGHKQKERALDTVKRLVGVYQHHKVADYERIQQRRRKIESYKETSERVKEQKTAQAIAERTQMEERKRAEEKIRLEIANKEQEQKRRLNEQEEVQRKIRADKMKKLQSSSLYTHVLKNYTEEELANMDPEEVLREQRLRLDADRQEQQQKLQQQEKKFDHQIRAFHLEELKERRAVEDHRRTKAPKLFKEYEDRRVAAAIAKHENATKMWAQLEAVHEIALDWFEKVKENRADEFAAKRDEFYQKVDAVRQDRLADRAEARAEERRREWRKKKAEEERRRREDEERQKMQLLEDQRRAARGDRPERRGDRMDDASKAMADDNWRGGGGRPAFAPRSDFDRSGDRDRDRAPMRGMDRGPPPERDYPSSAADTDRTWRSGMGVPARAPPAREPMRDGPSRDSERVPFRAGMGQVPERREPIARQPPSVADQGAWTRGNVVARPERPEPTPSPAAEPARQAPAPQARPGAYVPPSMRKNMGQTPGAPAGQGPEQSDDGFTSVRRGMPTRPPPQQQPPIKREGPPPRQPPAPRSGNAESDNNWRRN
ncbi:unnamed protein product, partial [Mesorhabditis spiculigera]